MAVLPIRQIGDPVLRTRAEPVPHVDASVRKLIADMHQTNEDAGGIGIAAPQVGVDLRVFIWEAAGSRGAVVNPQLETVDEPGFVPQGTTDDGDPEWLREGCLSVGNGIHAPVRRYLQVVLTGFDEHGQPLRVEASGLLAACFQHEFDHLNGMLFLDRLDGEHRRSAMRALRELT